MTELIPHEQLGMIDSTFENMNALAKLYSNIADRPNKHNDIDLVQKHTFAELVKLNKSVSILGLYLGNLANKCFSNKKIQDGLKLIEVGRILRLSEQCFLKAVLFDSRQIESEQEVFNLKREASQKDKQLAKQHKEIDNLNKMINEL